LTITDDDIRNQAQWAAGPKSPHHESKVARAEFVSGFVEGARWARLQTTAALGVAEDRQANAERAADTRLRELEAGLEHALSATGPDEWYGRLTALRDWLRHHEVKQ
jgi:hypothetical protein